MTAPHPEADDTPSKPLLSLYANKVASPDTWFAAAYELVAAVNLTRQAGFPLDIHDEDLLRRLTRHAEWAGRYPIAAKFKDAGTAERFLDGDEYHVAYLGGNDVDRARDLVRRLVVHIRTSVWGSTNLDLWLRELGGAKTPADTKE